MHPELYLAYHGRALAYYKEGMVKKALEDFDQAIAIKSDYASALRNRGVVYANEGRLTEACSDLNKALGIYETRLDSGKVVFNQEKIKSDLMETKNQLRSCR
jgi:tetratricopeptide (TPR) repeat protein